MSDDEVIKLSSDALAALDSFYAERLEKESTLIQEDWQLSQFWYDTETSKKLVDELISVALNEIGNDNNVPMIACVSSPSLIEFFHEAEEYKNGTIGLKLFEFDRRFGIKYPDEFVEYDYKNPTVLPEELLGKFDVIVADPPFLAAECLIKTSHTLRLLGKHTAKFLLCTGAIMEDYASRLLGMHRTSFEPKHANNLANDFSCFANYKTIKL